MAFVMQVLGTRASRFTITMGKRNLSLVPTLHSRQTDLRLIVVAKRGQSIGRESFGKGNLALRAEQSCCCCAPNYCCLGWAKGADVYRLNFCGSKGRCCSQIARSARALRGSYAGCSNAHGAHCRCVTGFAGKSS